MHFGAHIRLNRSSRTPSYRVGGLLGGVALLCFVPLFPPIIGASAQVVPDTAPTRQEGSPTKDPSKDPKGDPTKTAPSTPSATQPFPDDPRLAVALTMLSKGALEEARQTAHTVLVARSDCDRAAAIEGIALNKLKRYEEAKPLLLRARDSKQAFPEQKHAAHFLGWCHYHLGELALAKAAFDLHLLGTPKEPDSTFGLGLIALAEDQLDQADAHFAAALEGFSKPRDRPVDRARVLTRQADVALRRDDVVGAEAFLRRAVEASAVQHETWSKLARVYDRQAKTKEADAARANADRILTALGRKPATDASTSTAPAVVPPGTTTDEAPPSVNPPQPKR